jgi:hypothetical protein
VPPIGSLNEPPLHAALKEWFRHDGDLVEHPVHGFVVDLVRGGLLIEIQTRGFSAMRRKLDHLLDIHLIQIVYPIATRKWITRIDRDGTAIYRRVSDEEARRLLSAHDLVIKGFDGVAASPLLLAGVLSRVLIVIARS